MRWRYVLESDARAVVAVGLLGLGLAVLTTLIRGAIPPPAIHDEFSYLLAADTFAHGRLANPPHPLFPFFETFHVLHKPTYASKYPPAQGLFLAVGQVLTGQPIAGVWLSYGLMCAAFTWMLLAWTGRRWAVAGGAVAALFLVGFHADKGSWASSYWGGAVAAMGGALLFGGVGRLTKRPSPLAAVVMTLGVGLLANSRPFEGLLASLPVALYVLAWLARGRQHTWRWRMVHVGAPSAITLAVIGAGMAAYNTNVTGSAKQLPYVVYERTYAAYSPFLFGKRNVVTHANPEMAKFYRVREGPPRSGAEILTRIFENAATHREFFLPLFVAVLAFLLPAALTDRSLWLPAASAALVTMGLAGETWAFAHYAAPAAGAFLLLGVGAARRLRVLRVGRVTLGANMLRLLFAGILLSALAYPVFRLAARSYYEDRWYMARARIIDRLEKTGGKHLILVDYSDDHNVNEEWVYNRADIDGSSVVWARSLGARDSSLVRYYRDREIWTLNVDKHAGEFDLIPLQGSGGGR